jgi:CRP-like cAMP-binding protein
MDKGALGRIYEDGADIIRQNEVGDCMYVIQQGDAQVLKDEGSGPTLVDIMHAGDIFGEMAIIEKQVRSATVRAIGRVRVLTIDKKTFLRRVQEDPSLAFMILRALSNRVRKLDIELAALKSAREIQATSEEPDPQIK